MQGAFRKGAAGRAPLTLCLLLSALFLAGLCACSQPAKSQPRVVATSFGSYSIAKAVAGEQAIVSLMSAQGEDPHGYKPDAYAIANLGYADSLLTMGEEVDAWLPGLQKDIDRAGTVVLDLSDEGDPHRLLLPRESASLALTIGEQLGALDERHRQDYADRAQVLAKQLEELDVRLCEAIAHTPVLAVAGANPYGCLEESLGVSLVAVSESCDGERGEWDEQAIADAKKAGAAILLYTERDDEAQAQALAQELGVPALRWHALHMVSQQARKDGVTVLSLLEEAVSALEDQKKE